MTQPDPPEDSVFRALADPTRRKVMRRLSEEGPVSATELAGHLPVSRQAVAKHLDALGRAGLVEATREGRETLYRLTPGPLKQAMEWMTTVGAQWDRRLVALRRNIVSRRRGG